jgi:uracil-DNA glycosylase
LTSRPARRLTTSVAVAVTAMLLAAVPSSAVAPATGASDVRQGRPAAGDAGARTARWCHGAGRAGYEAGDHGQRDQWLCGRRVAVGQVGEHVAAPVDDPGRTHRLWGVVRGHDREQGTGTTPLGTYAITETFGNAPRPTATTLPFHRVRQGGYWVPDNRSAYYNYPPPHQSRRLSPADVTASSRLRRAVPCRPRARTFAS